MPEAFNQVDFIAQRFGGRRAYADALNVGEHRVRYWAKQGFVPEEFRPRSLREARLRGIDHTPFDFIRHLVNLAG